MENSVVNTTLMAFPSGSLPIRATSPRRIATLCAISLLRRVRRRFGDVLFLTSTICVKYGDSVDLAEAASMEFVRQHTSVPVPKVHCAFKHQGQTYIVMERIQGQKLAVGWLERSEESKLHLLAQLRSLVDEIRTLKPRHGSSVCSVDGGSLFDMRLPGLGVTYPTPTSRRFGPFEDIALFHLWLRRPVEKVENKNYPEVNSLVTMHDTTDWGSPIFTHGDLSSLNVLVRGESIVGIVDWETAGWYPSYWEYTTASQVNFRNEMWAAYIDKFLEPRPTELEMERIRMKYFGDT